MKGPTDVEKPATQRSVLPIDSILPQLNAALETHRCVVVEAAPGAGKTTRLPLSLYQACRDPQKQVIVTEPRRLAARLAARYVAQELGRPLGDAVGYSVRFEDKTSAKTRIRYVTEGVLLRQLLKDPNLDSAWAVVLDEFHERHLASDQLLMLLKRLVARRSNLRLVVMSATLDADPICRFLGNCPKLRCEGRAYPLTIHHEETTDDRPLEKRVSSAIKQALQQQAEGHVLVFLPGMREISQTEAIVGPQLGATQVLPLHGDMALGEQARAVDRSDQRKVVLATNVAESSLTIDGVTAVVDSGLARVAGYSPWTGRSTLAVEPVSQSSAIQRAGRAGRTAPGVVYRLFSRGNFKSRPAQTKPELMRMDLSELVLSLFGLGLRDLEQLEWLEAPPAAALHSATELLRVLGAVKEGELTPVGQAMLGLPLPPRLARLVIEGARLGVRDDACLAAALLSERDIRAPRRGGPSDLETGSSDIQERIDRFREAEYDDFSRGSLRAMGLDAGRVGPVRRAYRQLLRIPLRPEGAAPSSLEEAEMLLRRSLLVAFSDRVARRQNPQSRRLTLVNGSRAELSDRSVAKGVQLMVALDVEERWSAPSTSRGATHPSTSRGATRQSTSRNATHHSLHPSGHATVSMVSAVEADWLLEDYAEQVQARDDFVFNPDKQRVEEVSRLTFGSVTLEESRNAAQAGAQTAAILWEASKTKLAAIFGKRPTVEALQLRIAVLRRHMPELELPPSATSLEGLLRKACEQATSVSELVEFDYDALIHSTLNCEQQSAIAEHTPEYLQLPGGRRLKVQYEPGKPPWVASRLQDFFGMQEGPSICSGRLKLTLHLLAPNQRAVQVTSDLSGFWERHYTEVRKELRRRYAKHAWPEDGRTASPPKPRARR